MDALNYAFIVKICKIEEDVQLADTINFKVETRRVAINENLFW